MTPAERQRRRRAKAKVTRKELRGNDPYPTHPELLERLLDAEDDLLPETVWEPCSGAGNLVRVMLARGRRGVSSDVVAYADCPDQHIADFLKTTTVPDGAGLTLTNPAYRDDMGATFVRHALSLRPATPILMLLPLQFLVGKSRADLHARLVKAWLFRRRPERMHRLDHTGPKAAAQLDVGWFLLYAHHVDPFEVTWL